MHKQYISNLDVHKHIDFEHYKTLWQQALIDTNSNNLYERLSYKGVVGSQYGYDISILDKSVVSKYIDSAEKNTVAFINTYNTFYTDSYLTFVKLTGIARWRHCLDNLNNSPLHAVKHEVYKEEDFLLVWMFKHNIKYTIIDKQF